MPQAISRSAANIQGISLADAAEIDPHAGPAKADRPPRRVQFHQMTADQARASASCVGRNSPARRANPHASHSGADVTSYAPSVSSYKVIARPSRSNSGWRHRDWPFGRHEVERG